MIIDGLRSEQEYGKARIAATVRWEDSNLLSQEVFFETDEAFAGDLSCNPHAFLAGCVIPAFYHGEKRIAISEEICPELKDGLNTVMAWMRHWWYEPDRPLVQIEAKTRAKVLTPDKAPRAGIFVSGGVDGWAAIRENRLRYPLDHPGSFKDAIVVQGLHLEETSKYAEVLSLIEEVTNAQGLTLIPIHTNIVSVGYGWDFWANECFAGAFASIAHAFTKRLSVVSLASAGWGIPHIVPHGSHPLIDHNYSSSDLRLRHEGVTSSRLNKVRVLAGWDLALKHLRVCNQTTAVRLDRRNCGRCEKCVRTMLEFLALGALDGNPAFDVHDVSPELVASSVQINSIDEPFYEELLEPLRQRGRNDLVAAIKSKQAQHQRAERMRLLKTRIKQLDRKYSFSGLTSLKRMFRGSHGSSMRRAG